MALFDVVVYMYYWGSLALSPQAVVCRLAHNSALYVMQLKDVWECGQGCGGHV